MKKNSLYLFSFGIILRIVGMGVPALWYDEAFTGNLARLPFVQMMAATAGDTHPPFYYILTWAWGRVFSTSEFSLRAPSVIASIVALYVFWKVLERYDLPNSTRSIAFGIMALSPAMIWFAQEARMYSLLVLEVMLAVYFIQRGRWVATALAITTMLYTHNYGLFYLPALVLIAVWPEMQKGITITAIDRHRQKIDWENCYLRQAAAATVAPFFAWLPWAAVLLYQMDTISGAYWIQPVTLGGVVYALFMMLFSFSTPDKFQVVGVMVICGLAIYATWHAVKNKRLALLLLAISPLCLAIIGSMLWQPVFLFRGLLPSAPFLYLMFAQALDQTRSTRLVAGVLLLPLVISGLLGHYLYMDDLKPDVERLAIKDIAASLQPGEIVYHVSDGSAVLWDYYAPDVPLYEFESISTCGSSEPGSLSIKTRQALGIQQIGLDQLDYESAYLIYSVGPLSPTCIINHADDLRTQANLVTLFEDTDLVTTGVYYAERIQSN